MSIEGVLAALRDGGGLVPTLGIELEVQEDQVIGSLTLGPEHAGAPGVAHGGTIMALLDSVLGFHALALALEVGRATSTVELKTNFLRPARVGQRLVVRPEVQSRGRSLLVLSGHAEDVDTGERVAFAVGTFNLYAADRLLGRTD